jgi:hypothetical protein
MGTAGHEDDDDQQSGDGGQVSELAQGGGSPEPISSGDSVAGQPEQESGAVEEGTQGPDAVPDDPTGEHPHKP